MSINELITFIVPAYNAAQYIESCVKNILNIPYNNIELIVVNDGSTDNTLKILSKITDSRLKVITQSNKGVAAARNTGIKNSNGRYVTFIDVDDVVISEEYGHILNSIKFDEQIYMFSYTILQGNKLKKVNCPLKKGRYGKKEAIELRNRLFDNKFSKNYISHYFGGKVYQYLYERNFLQENNIFFQEGIHYAEDCIFCFSCFNILTEFEVLDYCPYRYVVYDNSASHKYRPEFWNELLDVYNIACKIANEEIGHKNELLFYYGIDVMRRTSIYLKDKKTIINKINEMLNNNIFINAINNMEFDNWTIEEKIIIYLCKNKNSLFIYHWYLVKYKIKSILCSLGIKRH